MSEPFVHIKKFRRIFDEVLPHPSHVSNLETVTSLIAALKNSEDLADLRLLQQKLLNAVSEAEHLQREAGEKKKALDRYHKATVQDGRRSSSVDKKRLQELRRESDKLHLEVYVLKRIRRQLRTIGDGLMWKAVGFNRAYVYAIWDAPAGGNTSLSEPVGLNAELEVVEQLWESKRTLAVMHDLTNCGRVGDLTMISSDETENIKIAEVKAASYVGSTQTKRMRDLVHFTRQGSKTLENGYTIQSSEPLEPPASLLESGLYNMDTYAQAIFDAGEKGVGWETVGNCMGLLAFTPGHPRWDRARSAEVSENERAKLYKEAFEPAGKAFETASITGEDAKVFVWDTSETQEDSLFGFPFSLYPFPSEFCAALTCDYIKLMVYLNVSNVRLLFENSGLQVTETDSPKDRNKLQFFWSVILSRQKSTEEEGRTVQVHLNKPLWQQIMGEGLSIDAVLEAVKEEMKGEVEENSIVSLLFVDGDGRRYKMVLPA